MLGYILRRIDRSASTKFLNSHPDWKAAQTKERMLAIWASHPVWRRVSPEMRDELANRMCGARKYLRHTTPAGAFAYVVTATHVYDLLHERILAIDKSPNWSMADKLWLVSEAFRQVGSLNFENVVGDGRQSQDSDTSLLHALMGFEAAFCVDQYRVDALMQLVNVYAVRNDQIWVAHMFQQVETLIDSLPTAQRHATGNFHRAQREQVAVLKEQFGTLETSLRACGFDPRMPGV